MMALPSYYLSFVHVEERLSEKDMMRNRGK